LEVLPPVGRGELVAWGVSRPTDTKGCIGKRSTDFQAEGNGRGGNEPWAWKRIKPNRNTKRGTTGEKFLIEKEREAA